MGTGNNVLYQPLLWLFGLKNFLVVKSGFELAILLANKSNSSHTMSSDNNARVKQKKIYSTYMWSAEPCKYKWV